MTHPAENGLPDAEVLALMRLLAPVVEHRRHYGLNIEDPEVYARAVLDAGYRLTEACAACQGSGLYPNPTGVFYAPTEWLGCPDCQGAGRVIPPARRHTHEPGCTVNLLGGTCPVGSLCPVHACTEELCRCEDGPCPIPPGASDTQNT